MLVQKMCGGWNKMWINIGLPVLLVVIAVQCIESELSREAAFQGRCGHGSPCDQVCFELHDGTFECDCTEGYELNKNGYSCQVINSTYQSNDLSGTEEDVLYQSDASFSAKLDNSYSHNNKQSYNKSVSNGDKSQSSSSVNNLNRNSKSSRYNKSNNVKNVSNKQLNAKPLNKVETSKGVTKQTTGSGISTGDGGTNQNILQIDDDKKNVDFYNTIIDWNQNIDTNQHPDTESTSDNDNNDYSYNGNNAASDDTDEDEDDLDYNGSSSSGSDSIVIKIGSKDESSRKLVDNTDAGKPSPPMTASPSAALPSTVRSIVIDSMTLVEPNTVGTSINASASTANSNYNYNNENYYSKDDMSVYDDVNNNRLNLRSSSTSTSTTINNNNNNNGRSNAYEERNIYVANNVLSDGTANESVKSYIHIEVYKGNLDGTVTAKPKEVKSINAFDVKATAKSVQLLNLHNGTDRTAEISTTKPEPCLLDCGSDGVCDNGENAMRCLCPFGKSGTKCENVADSLSIPQFTKHSWIAFSALRGAYKHVQLYIEFKPESSNGIILLTGERDDLSGDFLAVLIDQGHIEFWFDCGSGTGKVRSDTEVMLNQWNTLTVYRYRWDAWIQLNNGQRVQGRSKGLFSRITFREPVFLGGTGNITGLAKRFPVSDGMTGCIRKFVANEHEYVFAAAPSGDITQGFDIQECVIDRCGRFPCRHGGKCLPSDQGAICLCPLGFGGDLCEMRLDLQVPLFNGSSYLRFAPLGDTALIWLELQIIVKPQSENGLILYSGHHEYGDYISLSLNNGFVEFAFELGSGPAVVRSESPLSMEQWHIIRISRTARLAVMKIDQLSEVMTVSPNGFWHLSLPHSLYLGGSNNAQYLPLNLKELGSFVGCIQKLEVNGRSIAIISEAVGGTNVDNCLHSCTSKPCGPLAQCVPNLESYECQCNPSNLQCNKAEELSSVQQTRSSLTSFNFTGVSDNRSSIPANDKNALDSTLTTTLAWATAAVPNSITASTQVQTNLHEVEKTEAVATAAAAKSAMAQPPPPPPPTIANDRRKYNDKVIATLGLSDTTLYTKSPVLQLSDPHAKSDRMMVTQDHSDNKRNNNENAESYSGMASGMGNAKDSEGATDYYYYYDDDYEFDDSTSDAVVNIRTTPSSLAMATTATTMTTTAKPTTTTTTISTTAKQLTAKPMGISTDDDVTRIFGRYMSIDMEKLLKKEEMMKNKKLKNLHNKSVKPPKKHYIPMPLLEPQSPSLVDDEVEIDIMLPTTKNDQPTTTVKAAIESEKQQTTNDKSTNANDQHTTSTSTDASISAAIAAADDDDDDNDDDEMSGEFDVMGFYSNEDVLTTKELIDDMARIMKNGAEIRRNQMNHKTKYVRKSHGACFTGADSYFHYNDAETMKQIISYKIDLNLRFKTHSHNGLILWTGRHTAQVDDDYLLLGIENGYLHFRYNLGSGEVNIVYNTTKVSDGLWHRIRILRNLQDGSIEVDGGVEVSKRSPGKLRQLNTDTGLYVGGMPDIMYYTSRRYYSGIIGCISEIVLGGELKLSLDPETLGLAHNVEPGYF
ncbi:uncharacterized protein LOC129578841 [Sitodiplosis mosellana]|uniref:uncharacterized protein LOC129578841 n=1 Tax=Sitodiplosis mosellana TaxID=263140 RepID=UPI00244423A5|nr:uncharacterized protein LOC129578841 [Sitodiplosis mosellana]